MRFLALFLPIAVAVLLAGCGAMTAEEVGRIKIDRLSTQTSRVDGIATVQLNAGDKLAIWSEMDVEYEGTVDLRWVITIKKDKKKHGQLSVNPMEYNLVMNEVKTDLDGDVEWSYSAKNTEMTFDEAGSYAFQALLLESESSHLTALNKADLVFKLEK